METDAKVDDLRISNINACLGVLETIRTSLGPRGMDKMVTTADDKLIVTNDGATIMRQLAARHPAARMLVELSASQDVEAGDGTTSVVVFASALLGECLSLFKLGIHPSKAAESFLRCGQIAQDVISLMADPMAIPADADDFAKAAKAILAETETGSLPEDAPSTAELNEARRLINIVRTCLSSKIISPNSAEIAPICVQAVLRCRDPLNPDRVDLDNIRVVEKEGGTLSDTQLLENGYVFPFKAHALPVIKVRTPQGQIKRVRSVALTKSPKIALCQFCFSPPKTHLDSSVSVTSYNAMDALIKEEQEIAREQVRAVIDSGAKVVIVQKNTLREAVSELFLTYAANNGIMVIGDVAPREIDFISRTTGATPVASIGSLCPEVLGECTEVRQKDGMVFLTGAVRTKNAIQASMPSTALILVRGHNKAITAEAERSIHDALCVVRCLVKRPELVVGGAAVESLVSATLEHASRAATGVDPHCFRAFSRAARIIPATLAENAGLPPLQLVSKLLSEQEAARRLVTEGLVLKNAARAGAEGDLEAQIAAKRAEVHAKADHGINMVTGEISSMKELRVYQPALVSSSMIALATEMTTQILKISDMLMANF